jgi:hypothetical protein
MASTPQEKILPGLDRICPSKTDKAVRPIKRSSERRRFLAAVGALLAALA